MSLFVANHLKIAADKVLDMISTSDLKAIVKKLLAHSVAGPIVKEELLASSDDSLVNALEQAERLKQNIMKESADAIEEVTEEAYRYKGMEDARAWSGALSVFLPRIRDLADQGPLVYGPDLAWDALLHVANECILPKQGGDVRLQSGEEDCDDFHKEVDELMLHICRLQEADGKTAWLQEFARKNEIWELQDQAEPPHEFEGPDCRYRYQTTLRFLEYFGTEKHDRRELSEND